MEQNTMIAAMVQAAMDRDENDEVTEESQVTLAALAKMTGDADALKQLDEEIGDASAGVSDA